MTKVWKLWHSPFLRYPTTFSQDRFLPRKWLSFIPSSPEISTSKFSGVLNTMTKVESSSIHYFWNTPQHFLKNTFFFRRWPTFIPRAPEISTSMFSGVQNTMTNVWKLQHSRFLRYPTAFPQNRFLLRKCFVSFQVLQKSLLVSFQGWQRFEISGTHHFWDTPQHFLKTHVLA